MPPTLVLISLGFFTAIILAVVVITDWSTERRALRRTIRGVDHAAQAVTGPRDQQLQLPVFGRIIRPAFENSARLGRRFSPAEAFDRIEQDIVYAGNPPGWDAERVFAFKIIVPFVAGFGAFALGQLAQLPSILPYVMTALFVAAGWYAPEWIVRSRAKDRQHDIRLSLADTLDLMSITVEAGLSFDAALNRVARNIKGPLGQEMYRVVQEIQLGKSRGEALRDLSTRTTVEDLKSFIAAMVQADAFGIPIVRVLNVQSREIRIRRRQRAEEQAQKLPVKIVFPVVLTIFPALFVVLLGPAAIQIYDAILR